ncbi:RNA 2',3'-cyclic phosphodiesterase [Shewanella submarina]|uniref:RNA 2',3'-cyclic phosphodiesterase n=1 Tax=Shewanella submarina TaxID=2016376 RepID=A0ABV7GFE4_9GAMM|nr:RNA 2',3'-cyclic phosphodiesterase [Shewanella submarina]MCL1035905.1 RNA 2',3'-cyclic phosphodiesterase [Shewanella submarina]
MKRLFLGFAPSEAQTQTLQQLQQNCAPWGQPVPQANLHMTLAFFGMLDLRQEAILKNAVGEMDRLQFNVTLDTLSHWPGPRILCLSGKTMDSGLQAMASTTQDLVKALGLTASEHSYTPHITLSRKARGLPPEISASPIILEPTELHLYHSHNPGSGVQYDIIQSWPLSH